MKIKDRINAGQAVRTSIQSHLRRIAHVSIRHPPQRIPDRAIVRASLFGAPSTNDFLRAGGWIESFPLSVSVSLAIMID
jgi:hypothetical protein